MQKTLAPEAPSWQVVDPLGLDATDTLSFVVSRRRSQDMAAADELRGVAHWAELHRVSGNEVGSVDPDVVEWMFPPGPGSGDQLLGLEGELRLAGQGAFTVEEFAVCQLAAALGMSEPAARAYVGQAIELRDRLPRLWLGVMSGTLPAWKARKIAEQTIPLNAAAADYVDRQLAAFAHKISFGRILAAVEAAVLRHDPATAAERAAVAAERRGVWVDDHVDGVSEIHAVTNTPDAVAFDTALNHVASALEALGDTDPEQVRRAKAIGVLADPQYALDVRATAEAGGAAKPRKTRQGPTIHLHLHVDAVEGTVPDDGTGHLARVQGLGARSMGTVEKWLSDLAPGAEVKVTPVVDLGECISVDSYEIPDRLRAQVTERDDCCRFPWCGRKGIFDLDHIVPYVSLYEGGPPGQTNSLNLARLCRFHHRVKTHSSWTYERDPDGTLTWTSPLGRSYLVDASGTIPQA